MKLVLACIFAALLSGCVCDPPKIVYETIEVKVPVAVRCTVKYPAKPVGQTAGVPKDFFGQGILILNENVEYRMYSMELEAALIKCADPVP